MTPVSKSLIGLASGLGLVACAAVATSADDHAPETLCELSQIAIPGGTRLEARVFPQAAMTGSYELTVRDTGRGGSSSIDQSGDFSAARGDALVLGEIELSTQARHLDASLTLRTGGKVYTCPLRSRPTSI